MMKLVSILITLYFAAHTAAINLVSRDNPRVARLDIQRHEAQDPLRYDRERKRQRVVQQDLDNGIYSYYANVRLGTPAQRFRLFINTGASDMWVNIANSTLCSTTKDCATSGTYNANQSSTYKYVNGAFSIKYADGSMASGQYATDTLGIGDQLVQNMQFGIANISTTGDGLLGIGYAIDEAQVVSSGLAPYPNLPQALARDGKINSNAYSLWLNDLDASTGSILFGGVDTAKYTGSLQSVPIIPADGKYSDFSIALTAVGQNGVYNLSSNSSGIPALLESGTTMSYLPKNITDVLYEQVNANKNTAEVDCRLASRPGTIDFSFSGVNISVPLRSLIVPLSNGQPYCSFGIRPTVDQTDNNTAVLGDTFLRAAYVVYDLDNNQISLAQTKYNVTEEKIVEIARGRDGVPTSIFNAPTSTPTSRGGGATSTITTSAAGDGNSPTGLSTGAKAGIGVGAVAGVSLIVGAVLLLIQRRRKTHSQPDTLKRPTAQAGGDLSEFVGRA